MNMKKAVVLFSGGLDSTTCLAYAKSQGYDCYALSFEYGQKHNVELKAAKEIARDFNVSKHQVINLALNELGKSALTDDSIAVPDFTGEDIIPVTYVPARNTVFLSIALGWAEVLNAEAIFIGISAIDYSCYPDCRPEYIKAFQNLANLATKTGVEGTSIRIETPLINLDKAETIALGQSLGIAYTSTVTCYQPSSEGLACGKCNSCVLRKKGFTDLGVTDQTRYI
jgi:7-cyano-7-deazaguanine synthase